jgi:GAF domain-containing protein
MDEEPRLLSDVLAELASMAVESVDVAEMVHLACDRARALLASGGAIVLLSVDGSRMEPAGSSGAVGDIDAILRNEGFPCRVAMQTGDVVRYAQETGGEQFPSYTADAGAAGIHRVMSVPLRHGVDVFGTLSMVRFEPTDYTDAEVEAAQQLADVVAANILKEQTLRAALAVSAQLEHALQARVVIEQAKGMVAADLDVTIDEALHMIRAFARRQQLRLSDVASDIVGRALPVELLRYSS